MNMILVEEKDFVGLPKTGFIIDYEYPSKNYPT